MYVHTSRICAINMPERDRRHRLFQFPASNELCTPLYSTDPQRIGGFSSITPQAVHLIPPSFHSCVSRVSKPIIQVELEFSRAGTHLYPLKIRYTNRDIQRIYRESHNRESLCSNCSSVCSLFGCSPTDQYRLSTSEIRSRHFITNCISESAKCQCIWAIARSCST